MNILTGYSDAKKDQVSPAYMTHLAWLHPGNWARRVGWSH